MKRSVQIRLVLLGGISAGAFTACGPSTIVRPFVPDTVYGNDHKVEGVGYYHAPYGQWYALPYNHYDPQRKLYFHGGLWTPTPHASIVNLSEPKPEALQQALARWQRDMAMNQAIQRSGFGSTSRSHFSSS